MRYNPYPYNPRLQSFFQTDMPDTAAKVAAEQPQLAQHVNSVWRFLDWLQKSSPQLYAAITNKRPDLADPASVVTSGALGVAKKSNLNGYDTSQFFESVPADYDPNDPTNYDSTKIAASVANTATSAGGTPVTQWGQDLLSVVKTVLPAYYQASAQRDLLSINVKRAEQGLSPIDGSAIAPQVNVGVSKNVQMLGFAAVGGLVFIGLMSAFKSKR